MKDTFKNFKHLRKTAHTHHPVNDVIGNAEALLLLKKVGLKNQVLKGVVKSSSHAEPTINLSPQNKAIFNELFPIIRSFTQMNT